MSRRGYRVSLSPRRRFPAARPVSEVTITLFRYMVFSLKNPEPPLIDKTFIFMQLKQINHQNEDLRSF
jgi:hypothetical protein